MWCIMFTHTLLGINGRFMGTYETKDEADRKLQEFGNILYVLWPNSLLTYTHNGFEFDAIRYWVGEENTPWFGEHPY